MTARKHRNRSVEIMQVIKITFRHGSGTESDPFRISTEFWEMHGDLIFTIDPYGEDMYEKAESK